MLFPRAALFDPLEQVLHAAAQFGGYVGLKMQLRHSKQFQASCDFAAQERGGMLQCGDGLRSVGALVHTDAHQGVPLVGRNLNAGDGRGGHARVRELVADHLGQFLAESF